MTGYKGKTPLVVGIIDILVGIFFLFNIGAGVVVLPFVFAVWFIADSVFALLAADLAKGVSNGYYWFTVIVNILGIILGIMLLFNPISSALTLSFLVGFYLVLLISCTHLDKYSTVVYIKKRRDIIMSCLFFYELIRFFIVCF